MPGRVSGLLITYVCGISQTSAGQRQVLPLPNNVPQTPHNASKPDLMPNYVGAELEELEADLEADEDGEPIEEPEPDDEPVDHNAELTAELYKAFLKDLEAASKRRHALRYVNQHIYYSLCDIYIASPHSSDAKCTPAALVKNIGRRMPYLLGAYPDYAQVITDGMCICALGPINGVVEREKRIKGIARHRYGHAYMPVFC